MENLTNEMTRLRGDIDLLRESRSAFLADLRGEVAGNREHAIRMVNEFRSGRTSRAGAERDGRKAFAANLCAGVGDMLKGFREERIERATETRAALEACVSEVSRFVSDLKKDTHAVQAAFTVSRRQKTKADRREREGFMTDLAHRVSALREDIRKVRMAFADDLAGARQGWSGVYRKPPAEQVPATDAEKTVQPGAAGEFEEAGLQPAFEDIEDESGFEERPAESFVPDELTLIPGVGPGRERMLNEAGIYTFAQIAGSTPERLRKAVGEMGRLAPVEKWIEEAGKLSEE